MVEKLKVLVRAVAYKRAPIKTVTFRPHVRGTS